MRFVVKPVGVVRRSQNGDWIQLYKEYCEALDYVDHFSHLIVIYWLHKVPDHERSTVKVKPPYGYVPTLGVFATRFPARPNPIGITTVRLIKRKGRALLVKGLDADDGTPILDLKPYIPVYDRPRGRVKLPRWVKLHLREHRHHSHTIEELLSIVERVHLAV
ncbi:MAG: tRNA (N6-threonylcarbamoyladenosine(37)-N6)-methyltransferase TrmO [Thermoprotei archaeon]|nr:MAG: tRNA (N6-threonylcarbamoyladenosine(37)-N6)-methyltransferase TrmO [Thermoprotei archaeon]